MKSKVLKSNDLRRKFVNENFIIRLDGMDNTLLEIHSAVGYELACFYGGKKFQRIIDKAIKKGTDKVKLQLNRQLTVTLYAR